MVALNEISSQVQLSDAAVWHRLVGPTLADLCRLWQPSAHWSPEASELVVVETEDAKSGSIPDHIQFLRNVVISVGRDGAINIPREQYSVKPSPVQPLIVFPQTLRALSDFDAMRWKVALLAALSQKP